MASNNLSTLEGLRKEVYGDDLEKLVPEISVLAKRMPMLPMDSAPGGSYNQPVQLTRAHGWTLNNVAGGGGAFALNDPQPAQSKNAAIVGSSFVMEETIGYDDVARLLATNGEGRKRAFVAATAYLVANMSDTAAFVREMQLLHGQLSTGTVSSITSNGTGTESIVITAATHIPALWAGLENGYIDIYDTTEATKRNAGGTIQVTAYDFSTRTITVQGTAAELATVAATDVIYLRGTKANGMVGLRKVSSNSTTLWTINAATYSLWAGNTYGAGSGPLTFTKVMRALNLPISRGGLMGDSTMICSPYTWSDCMNDLAALRRYANSAGGSMEQGASSLTFTTHAGSVELVPHLLMTPSEAVIYPSKEAKRIGPKDTTFKLPGSNENFFRELERNAGYGLRNYWQQALFLPCPAKCVRITGITNTEDA